MTDAVQLGGRLSVFDVHAVASRRRVVVCPPPVRQAMQAAHVFVQDLAGAGVPVYGLTTGCGPLASGVIAPEQREMFQRNLLRSHANTLGSLHPIEWTRAAMLLRAQVFALGHSGVDPATVDVLLAMLAARVHPLVREIGGVGASGDLVELAQIGLAVIGEGNVELDGVVVAARQALAHAAVEPLVPRLREGLALINGTCFHTGAAALLVVQAQHLLDAAISAASMAFEALGGHVEAYDETLHALRAHPGQSEIAERVRRLIDGSEMVEREAPVASRQDPYTLRCIPQILGPVAECLVGVRRTVEIEINSVTDNPAFFVSTRRVVHGGNFHGQPVALALDQLKTAVIEIGVASERRLARLLDPTLNRGLPAFLVSNAENAGFESGFMGLQYTATTMAAENALLSAPASVRSIPTNGNNQDVVSMGMLAARTAKRVVDNVTHMLAIELICAAQALELRGGRCGVGTALVLKHVRQQVAPLRADRILADDVGRVCELIEAGAISPTPLAAAS